MSLPQRWSRVDTRPLPLVGEVNSTLETAKRRKGFVVHSRSDAQEHLRSQSTYIYGTTVYVPSSELALPHPLSRKRVCPPRNQRGNTRLWVRG
jgi:hypothetical protein